MPTIRSAFPARKSEWGRFDSPSRQGRSDAHHSIRLPGKEKRPTLLSGIARGPLVHVELKHALCEITPCAERHFEAPGQHVPDTQGRQAWTQLDLGQHRGHAWVERREPLRGELGKGDGGVRVRV